MTREEIARASQAQISRTIKIMEDQGLSNKTYLIVLGDITDAVAGVFLNLINRNTDVDKFYAAIVTAEGLQEFFREVTHMVVPSLETVKDASMGETHVVILGDGGVTHYSIFKNTMVN